MIQWMLAIWSHGSMDYSPPGSSVHGIFQARILEWVAISFFKGIFPTQGLNLGLPHCRQILYSLSHQGSDRHTVNYWLTQDSNPGSLTPEGEVKVKSERVMSDSLRPNALYSPWNSPGQNTGGGSLSLLQGISQPRDWTQKEMATHCSTLAWKIPWMEAPGGLQSMGLQRVEDDWVAYLFSHIAGRFFTSWATREAPNSIAHTLNCYTVLKKFLHVSSSN